VQRKWLILVVIATAQLMVVLDATVVNIALPSAQRALHFANVDRQWVVTAYALSFGSLLLLGGRIGDLFGRKWTFVVGLAGFALASAVGGAAVSFGMLVTARAVQGVFGAILAPSALGMLTTTFSEPSERGKAFGIFSAVAGGGSAVGLVLGGVLTELLSWRFCLYVNLVFAIGAGIGALLLLRNEAASNRPRLDITGAVLASAGLFCLVLGFSEADTSGWQATITVVLLAVSAVLLVTFVLFEQRAAHPLLPMRIVVDRIRGGSYLSVVLSAGAIFAVFLFLTYYLQTVRDYSPITNGVAFLPLTAGIVASSTTGNVKLYPVLGARPMVFSGMLGGAVSMFALSRLGLHSSYATAILPWLLLMGVSFGFIFAPAVNGATARVDPSDAGIASAMVNTGQQVGGSVGVALLSTLAADATTRYLGAHGSAGIEAVRASVHGYTTAFEIAGGIFFFGALICGPLLPSGKPTQMRAPVTAVAH
jgi:EmrB/QacA subfamily drug resistance transporter